MTNKIDFIIVVGLIISTSAVLGTRFESILQQTDKLTEQNVVILHSQELINAAINQSVANNNEINNTQSAILGLNENLLTVYMKLLSIAETIDNNTDSNRNITIRNREMISFLRNNFDEQFLAELKQSNQMQQETLDNILARLNSNNNNATTATAVPSQR